MIKKQISKAFSFSPTLKGEKASKISSKLYPLGSGKINFNEI